MSQRSGRMPGSFAGDAFLVEVRHHFQEAVALLIVGVRRNQADDQVHGRIFLEHTGGTPL